MQEKDQKFIYNNLMILLLLCLVLIFCILDLKYLQEQYGHLWNQFGSRQFLCLHYFVQEKIWKPAKWPSLLLLWQLAKIKCRDLGTKFRLKMTTTGANDERVESPHDSEDESEDERDILEESPCGRWQKRRVKVRLVVESSVIIIHDHIGNSSHSRSHIHVYFNSPCQL